MAYEELGFLPDPAQNAGGVGHTMGDKRQMTDGQMLQTLIAQRDDPARDPASTSELEREIARLQKSMKVIPTSASLGFVPDAPAPQAAAAPRAQQGSVRAAEKTDPMAEQAAAERAWEEARKRYLAKNGVLPRGKTLSQAISEFSGLKDPAETRDAAVNANAAQTGELDYEDTPGYQPLKTIAGIGGFVLGGPGGATGAEAVVRLHTLALGLKKAVDAGAIDEDRAAEIMAKEMVKGSSVDAAFNFGIPLLGQAVMKIPGMKWLADKVAARLGATGPSADEAAQRARKLEKLGAQAPTPAAKQAVEEIGRRTQGTVPTPAQVTGEIDFGEKLARKGTPQPFAKQSEAIEQAVEGMRQDLVNPSVQPTAKALGERITQAAEDVQQAVKTRLRPVFQEADNLGVRVDLDPVLARAKAALAADAAIPGGKLAAREREDLAALVAQLEGTSQNGLARNSQVSAEAALDFISRQKEKLRATTADWKPSKFYETIVNGLSKDADTAFSAAAQRAGRGDIVQKLTAAQNDYREMMSTVYDDAVKAALKKNPEDVGRLFWQSGNVSEIEQLQKMLQIALREGSMTRGEVTKLSRDMTRGFMQEAIRDVGSAAKWSETLAADPLKHRTWETLTATPGGSSLRGAMEVLEQAAKIAGRTSSELLKDEVIPVIAQRAASGSMGVSNVSVKPGWIATGLSITGLTRAMATAYTQGNQGVLNAIMRALRANSVGTAAGTKALQEALPAIQKFAEENELGDVVIQAADAAATAVSGTAHAQNFARDIPTPTHYIVVNIQTGKQVGGPYKTAQTARAGLDRHDNAYGGYAHKVVPVYGK